MKGEITASDFSNLGQHWKQLMLNTLTMEDFLTHFKPADVLAHLNPEDIEDYLTHLKQSPRAKTANAKPKPKKRK